MYFISSLGDLLKIVNEDTLVSSFQNFSTKKDPDISNFLKSLAIDYEKNDISRTFLIFNEEYKGKVLGYFTIGLNVFKINETPKVKDAYEGINLFEQGYHPVYKLLMIGKDDNCPMDFSIKKDIFENEVMHLIREAKEIIGTNFLYLDCVEELLNYYRSLGFEFFNYNKKSKLYCMIRAI